MKRLVLVAFVIMASITTVSAAPPPVTEKMRPIPWDPAPLPKVEIPADRPRIWFTAAQVPELRKRCRTTCRAGLREASGERRQESEASRA